VDITTWEIGSNFVPIYVVRWQQLVLYRGEDGPPKFDPIGSIHFVAPERRILQMDVNRAKYIARNALTVPDRDRLLQQTDDPEVRELWFTTEPYKAAAMKTMLGEVNWAARSLGLPEKLPIEPSALRDVVIGTPYTADHQGSFATVFTEKYSYRATQKLTLISRAYSPGEEQHHFASIRTRYTMPLSRVNTNAVYCLATQWLAALSVDLRRLEADHPSRITVPWVLGGQFLPLYTVEWSKPIEHSSRRDVAAKVEVLEPERSLEQLVIEKPEYMMRPPITVPDRDKLLRQSNAK